MRSAQSPCIIMNAMHRCPLLLTIIIITPTVLTIIKTNTLGERNSENL